MKDLCPIVSLLIFLQAVISCGQKTENKALQDGDIIFQTSLSPQSKAIQLATRSVYSHCGIVFIENGKTYVFEAVQPVKKTALKAWVNRGKNGKYVVKRLRNSTEILTPEVLLKMRNIGHAMQGKNYDLTFEWSDERIYCSELIWKIYKEGAGIEIGKLERLGDFDLSHPTVVKIMKKRYGNHIPVDEKVISPAAIFESELLQTLDSN